MHYVAAVVAVAGGVGVVVVGGGARGAGVVWRLGLCWQARWGLSFIKL